MSANNIVKFPEKNVFRQVPDEQVHQAMLNSIKVNVENIVDDIGSELIEHMKSYDIDDEKTFLFMYDIIRSMAYKKFGIYHHLHPFLDKHVKLFPMKDTPNLTVESKFPDIYDDIPSDIEPDT